MNVFKRIDKKLNFAITGLFYAFRNEHSFLIHFLIEIPAVVLGFVFHISSTDWVLILLAISQLLISELFNTSLEFLIKLNNRKYSELAEILLNISSGAVLLSIVFGLIIGVIVFTPYII